MKAARIGRIEDERLLKGAGAFAADQVPPDALFAVFVRADRASAAVLGLDAEAAREMPGVVAVLTGGDMEAAGVGPVQAPMKVEGPNDTVWTSTDRRLLVTDRVRHVGEPVALVVAETLAQAMDAAEAVGIDYDDLSAVLTLDDAKADGAALVHDDRPGNLCAEWARGDWEAAGAAIEGSAHRVRAVTPVSRVTAVALEPRNAVARPLDGGRMELLCSHQNPVALRPALAGAFGMEPDKIRVLTGDVGGAFGMKSGPTREELVIFWAAKHLGRAVRWQADRGESFLTDEAARDVRFVSELGLDEDGTFTAMRFLLEINCGAYASVRSIIPIANFGGVAGVYRTPIMAGRMEGYLSHTVPTAPYRGAGRPEATYAVEALIDRAASECGFDRFELRRQNLIPADAMPWKGRFVFDYDCGDFERVLDAGLRQSDAAGFPARQAEAAKRGRVRGLGLAMCIETAGGMYANPGSDFTEIELHSDGSITLAMGTLSTGSGLETVMTDLAANQLGLAPERVRYRQGDTDVLAKGRGMGGSAAMAQGAPALRDGIVKLIEAAKGVAGDLLETDATDIEYADGVFRVAGTDRTVMLEKVAETAADRNIRLLGEGNFAPASSTFPNGCHVCEVEIDPETGKCEIVAYCGIEDIGTVINPQLAEGQIMGGVVQGLGQMLCEEIRYSPGEGQLLTGSFMDYAMPRAVDIPPLSCGFEEVPTALNPLGAKGVGEAGTVGALAAGMSAVSDALRTLGVERFEMPASPGRIWAAIQASKAPE